MIINLTRLLRFMDRGDVAGIAEELHFTEHCPIVCPVCDRQIPQPHLHCDSCESPYGVARCGQEGCQSYFCEKCQARHAGEHLHDYRSY